jgi:isopentenyl-diphosphate delta-isomerase
MTGDRNSVILVDAGDTEIGTADKLDAHKRGLRHRAISAFVRNSSGGLLLQRRHPAKYHSGGLWANACCSHPRPGEPTAEAARRRLREEMGISCPLQPLFTMSYRAPVSNNLIENEIVHAYGGWYDGPVKPDRAEVSEWKWVDFDTLVADVTANPQNYAVWFRQYLAAHGGLIAGWSALKR